LSEVSTKKDSPAEIADIPSPKPVVLEAALQELMAEQQKDETLKPSIDFCVANKSPLAGKELQQFKSVSKTLQYESSNTQKTYSVRRKKA
jgi:hypothetical protein